MIIDPPEAEVGAIYPGKVVNITKFGAFVNILPGRDGLLHISKLGGGKRVERVESVLTLGQEVEVKVDDIDPQGKVSLSLAAELAGFRWRGRSRCTAADRAAWRSCRSRPGSKRSSPATSATSAPHPSAGRDGGDRSDRGGPRRPADAALSAALDGAETAGDPHRGPRLRSPPGHRTHGRGALRDGRCLGRYRSARRASGAGRARLTSSSICSSRAPRRGPPWRSPRRSTRSAAT